MSDEKYRFDNVFERSLCAMLFAVPSVWRTIGAALKPDAMPSDKGKAAVKLAILAAGDSGVPGGIPIAYQMAEAVAAEGGKLAAEMAATMAWLEYGFDEVENGTTKPDALLRAAVSEVRRWETDMAAKGLIDDWAKRADPSASIEAYNRAQSIGGATDRGSTILTVKDRLNTLFHAATVETRPTGWAEIDAAMDGGLAVGNVGILAGGSGDGKSTAVMNIAAYTCGRLVLPAAIASCELRGRQSVLKFEAALWGVPINTIKAKPHLIAERYEMEGDSVAPFYFRHWDLDRARPTIANVFDWVEETEQRSGVKIQMLGIDHFDRFDPSTKAGARLHDYAKGEAVYDEIAQHTHDRGIVTWVPSQTVRTKRGPLWGPGDMAHSHHKEKRADGVISVNAGGKPHARTMTLFQYKNREGEANIVVGPRPAAFHLGRLFDIPIRDRVLPEYAGLLDGP